MYLYQPDNGILVCQALRSFQTNGHKSFICQVLMHFVCVCVCLFKVRYYFPLERVGGRALSLQIKFSLNPLSSKTDKHI